MGGTPSPFDRDAHLERLRTSAPFDVVVIGGGITGVGVALDAASRGLSTALVERDDFASGTSSKSSKLVHGGLRYLQQGDIRLVYEALHERQRLRRNAPHLVSVLPFMIPIFASNGLIPKKVARALGTAMWMYDLTGGIRLGKIHKRLRADAAHEHMPTLPGDRLSSAYLYYDATADDARLTLAIARTAAAHGAVMVNRCAVTGFLPEGGVRVTSTLDAGSPPSADGDIAAAGRTIDVPARVVVNATGVWSDEVRSLHEPRHPHSIRPAKGVHITVPWDKVRNDIAVVIPVRGDKRSLFVVPWNPRPDGTFEHCYVGTTDTDYEGSLDEPRCTDGDIDYILSALNAVLDPSVARPVTASDITGTWAGLRPLVGDNSGRTADLSRRHDVAIGDDGVVRVTGGKLTTYREMAEDTVNAVLRQLGRSARCRTKRLRLLGAPPPPRPWSRSGSAGAALDHLGARYGTLTDDLRELVADDPALGEPLIDGLPYLRAEAVYAVRCEMACTLDDILVRRTRAHLMDRDATRRAAPSVASLLAPVAGWDEHEVDRQLAAYEAMCDAEVAAERGTTDQRATPT